MAFIPASHSVTRSLTIHMMIDAFLSERHSDTQRTDYDDDSSALGLVSGFINTYGLSFYTDDIRAKYQRQLESNDHQLVDLFTPRHLLTLARHLFHYYLLRIVPFTTTETVDQFRASFEKLLSWMAERKLCPEETALALGSEIETLRSKVHYGVPFAKRLLECYFHPENETTPPGAIVEGTFLIEEAGRSSFIIRAQDDERYSLAFPGMIQEEAMRFEGWEMSCRLILLAGTANAVRPARLAMVGKVLPAYPAELLAPLSREI